MIGSLRLKYKLRSVMNQAKNFEQITDQDVIIHVLGGEISFYEIIIRRYNAYLYKIGRSYGFEHHDTEDLMQDTYLDAYSHLNNFAHRSAFKTWLVKIMLNNCYHKKQKSSHKKELFFENIIQEKAYPMYMQNSTGKTNPTINKELGYVLEKAILNIPVDYRMVFSLREMNGMSTIETSEALNISEANVKVRLNRAKAMLRNEIEKTYSPGEVFDFNLIYCDRIVENVMKQIQPKK